MIGNLVKWLIGIYFSPNQFSANGNGLPPGHKIITEEIVTHNGIRYLAMQISPPLDDESKHHAPYINVGIIVDDRVTEKEGGGTGTFRRVKVIDAEKIRGLVELVNGTRLTGDFKYDGEIYHIIET